MAIGVKLGLAKLLVEQDPAQAIALLGSLQVEAQEALEGLRDMTRGSRPPILADQGLVAALEHHATKASVPVIVDAEGIGRYDEDRETAVYYCCLESVQNAMKYARATGVTMSLRDVGRELSFAVADDGVGFDPATVRHGVGLRSMVERVEAVGGRIEVRSAVGSGTTVAGRIPVV